MFEYVLPKWRERESNRVFSEKSSKEFCSQLLLMDYETIGFEFHARGRPLDTTLGKTENGHFSGCVGLFGWGFSGNCCYKTKRTKMEKNSQGELAFVKIFYFTL